MIRGVRWEAFCDMDVNYLGLFFWYARMHVSIGGIRPALYLRLLVILCSLSRALQLFCVWDLEFDFR